MDNKSIDTMWAGGIIIAWGLFDTITTMLGMINGGKELNPLVRWVIHNYGHTGFIGLKSIGTIIIGILLYQYIHNETTERRFLQILFIIISIIVINNILFYIGYDPYISFLSNLV